MKHFTTSVKNFSKLFFNISKLLNPPHIAGNARRCRRGAHYIDNKPTVNTLTKKIFSAKKKGGKAAFFWINA